VAAARRLAAQAAAGSIRPDDIDDAAFASALQRGGVGEPDLIIRSSGEQRLSNFMLWQAAHSELVFCDAHWPDFGESHLAAAMAQYAARQRRFGGRAV
jgi:undecaprenyl diphosphate synthase